MGLMEQEAIWEIKTGFIKHSWCKQHNPSPYQPHYSCGGQLYALSDSIWYQVYAKALLFCSWGFSPNLKTTQQYTGRAIQMLELKLQGPSSINKRWKVIGSPGCSVRGASDSWPQGHKLQPHVVGCRDYLNNQSLPRKKKKRRCKSADKCPKLPIFWWDNTKVHSEGPQKDWTPVARSDSQLLNTRHVTSLTFPFLSFLLLWITSQINYPAVSPFLRLSFQRSLN